MTINNNTISYLIIPIVIKKYKHVITAILIHSIKLDTQFFFHINQYRHIYIYIIIPIYNINSQHNYKYSYKKNSSSFFIIKINFLQLVQIIKYNKGLEKKKNTHKCTCPARSISSRKKY